MYFEMLYYLRTLNVNQSLPIKLPNFINLHLLGCGELTLTLRDLKRWLSRRQRARQDPSFHKVILSAVSSLPKVLRDSTLLWLTLIERLSLQAHVYVQTDNSPV